MLIIMKIGNIRHSLYNFLTDFSTVTSFMSLVVTATDLVLVNENHQWPLPRLQGPLSEDMKGKQFTVVHREKINNIETCVRIKFFSLISEICFEN